MLHGSSADVYMRRVKPVEFLGKIGRNHTTPSRSGGRGVLEIRTPHGDWSYAQLSKRADVLRSNITGAHNNRPNLGNVHVYISPPVRYAPAHMRAPPAAWPVSESPGPSAIRSRRGRPSIWPGDSSYRDHTTGTHSALRRDEGCHRLFARELPRRLPLGSLGV